MDRKAARSVASLAGRKVLVTGGAGFIGSTLADSLLALGCDVTAYDRFDGFYRGKEGNVGQNLGNRGYRLVKGDVLDYASLKAAMKGATVVFHEAAQAGVRYCIDHPRRAHEVNATGTLNVLLAARENEVGKVVYASSSSLYGVPQRIPITEDHPLAPTNPYGASKLAAEKYCLAFHQTYGLDVACVRYFSAYGPRGRPDQALYAFAKAVSEGGRPTIYGDGSQSRDFTYVSDLVEGTILAATKKESSGQAINLGCGEEFSVNEVARRVIEYFGSPVAPLHREGYAGDFPRTLCSNEKARRLLGWTPRVRFKDGLPLFLDWFVENRMKTGARKRAKKD